MPVEDKEWTDSIFLSLDYVFNNGKGKLVIAKATSIQYDEASKSGKVLTEKGDEIPFDVLALATGSIWESPLDFGSTKAEAVQGVVNWREKIRDAKGVVLVGGGAVGIGEISSNGKWPGLKLMVHSKQSSPVKYAINIPLVSFLFFSSQSRGFIDVVNGF